MASFAERHPEKAKVCTTRTSKKARRSQPVDRIIEASRLEFIATGREAAKIESIAARANLTRQLVYYYYKNKDEIFYDIVIREAQNLVGRFNYLDIETTTPEQTIKELLLELFDNANQGPMLSTFMVDQFGLSECDKKAETIFTNMTKRVAKRLQALLDQGAEQGTLRPGVDAARFFAAACMITLSARHKGHALEMICGFDVTDKEEIDSWQRFAVDLLMRSIEVDR